MRASMIDSSSSRPSNEPLPRVASIARVMSLAAPRWFSEIGVEGNLRRQRGDALAANSAAPPIAAARPRRHGDSARQPESQAAADGEHDGEADDRGHQKRPAPKRRRRDVAVRSGRARTRRQPRPQARGGDRGGHGPADPKASDSAVAAASMPSNQPAEVNRPS